MAPRPSLDDLRIDRSRDDEPSRAWIWVLVAVGVAALGGGAWWWGGDRAIAVRTAAVEASQAGSSSAAAVLNASGYVTARRRATVSSKVTGKVIEVLVEEGMEVRKGQVLARLDDSAMRSQLALAEARVAAARGAVAELEVRLREAELTLGRTRQLVNDGVVGKATLDGAEAEVDSLKARIDLAREQTVVAEKEGAVRTTELADMVIRAPFDGVAISKDAQPGEMISPVSAGGGYTRTGISTIVDMMSLEIEVDVNESYINRVAPAQRVVARLDAYPDWEIPAHVITMVPTADRQRATVLVRIGFDALDPRILPDMGVKVAFLEDVEGLPADTTPRLLVPDAALATRDGQDVVFVVRGERVERRAVRLGGRSESGAEIVGGVSAGERVVVDPPDTLADGDAVVTR